ncbi:MAG: hypothetical protein JSS66_06800 [Armatimonadetes bacterium]|nr:hypothetical protein [Armatimonadota bacterium]
MVDKGHWEIWFDGQFLVASGNASGPATAKAACDAWMNAMSDAALTKVIDACRCAVTEAV